MAGINKSIYLPQLPPRPKSVRYHSNNPPPIPPRSITRPNSVRELVNQFHVLRPCNEEPLASYSGGNRRSFPTEEVERIYKELPARPACSSFNNTDADGYWSDSTFNTDSEEEAKFHAASKVSGSDPSASCLKNGPENAIDELLQNEQKYIDNMLNGVVNYIPVLYQTNLPNGLNGQRNTLFGNIEEIHELHHDDFLPALGRCHKNVERISECFVHFIETNKFYCYIKYAMNRRKANMILDLNKDFFSSIQHELNSFLLQPIQRIPRYKLFLDKFLKESQHESTQIASIHEAQDKLCQFVDLLNAAVSLSDIHQCSNEFSTPSPSTSISGFNGQNDLPTTLILKPKGNKLKSRNNPLDLFSQGQFRLVLETEIYDDSRYRRYAARFFVFEKLILYTEVTKDSLQYRGHYFDSEINYWEDTKKLHLYCIHRGTQEIQMRFNRTLADIVRTIRQKAVSDFFNEPQLIDFSDCHSSPLIHRTITSCQIDFGENIRELISSQIRFVQILRANYDFYLRNQDNNQSNQQQTYRDVFLKMISLHNDRIIMDLSRHTSDIEAISQFFLHYVKIAFPPIYHEYLRHFTKTSKIFRIRPMSFNSSSFLVSTADEFALLCIERLNEFSTFFGTLTEVLSDRSTRNMDIDKALFQQLAIVQVEMEKFYKSIRDNYELLCLDDGVIGCGFVMGSEQATVKSDFLKTIDCRIFLCERAAICVSYTETKSNTNYFKQLNDIIFYDRFNGGTEPMRLRKSKQNDGKVSFIVGGTKFKVKFKSSQVKDRFYEKYIQQYIM